MNTALAGLLHSGYLEISDDELTEIGTILKDRRGVSLSVYKDKCMKRRVAIRMRSNRCGNAAAYCDLLRQSEQELDLLQKVLTIHVSQFFRNPAMFEKLCSDVLPLLYRECKTNGAPLRIWSLGCAGGEEPYSLAIMLREYFMRNLRQTCTFIRATDIDEDTLSAARKAEFSEDRLKELPETLNRQYFYRSGSGMQLKPVIREMVEFSRGDIMATEAFMPADMVLCRNTLIYFNRREQEKILNGLADILPAGGFLVLGKSETLVGDVRNRFMAVCPVERIYRRH